MEFAWYTKTAYPLFIHIPFILILCFSFGIGIKVYKIRSKRNAIKGKHVKIVKLFDFYVVWPFL